MLASLACAACGQHAAGMHWHAAGMHLACALLASLEVGDTWNLVLVPPTLVPSAWESWGRIHEGIGLARALCLHFFTLLPNVQFSTPAHGLEAMLAECLVWIGLGEHISWLVFAVNGINSDLASVNIVPEVVVPNVDVLGTWANLGHGSNFDCATIVFKNPALNNWLSAAKLEAQSVKFLDCLHDGDGHAEDHAKTTLPSTCKPLMQCLHLICQTPGRTVALLESHFACGV